MRRKKIMEYLEKNAAKGYDLDSLKWALIKQGHSRTDVISAIEQVKETLPRKSPVVESPKIQEIQELDAPVTFMEKPWWKFW